MITSDQLTEIGTFNKPHGVKGEISATFDCGSDVARHFSCLVCDIDGIFVPFFATAVRDKTDQTLLMKIDGLDTDQQVRRLVNKRVWVLKEEYDQLVEEPEYDEDEIPLDRFIGFSLYDDQLPIGTITDYDDSTDNVLFVVTRPDGQGQILVPAADDLVTEVDLDAQRLTMSLPTGLLNM